MRIKQRVKNVIVYAALLLLATAMLVGLYILSSTPQPTTRLSTPVLGLGLDMQETQQLELQINSIASNSIVSGNSSAWTLISLFPGLIELASYDQFVLGADIRFSVKGEPGVELQLTGKLLANSGNFTYKGAGTLTTGQVDLPVQVLVNGTDLYLQIDEIDKELLTETQQIALDFAAGKWLHVDMSKYTDLLTSSLGIHFEVPPDKIAALQDLWQEEHIFVVAPADNYIVDGVELMCAVADLNASAFPTLNMSDRTFTVTLCTKSSSEIPIYLNLSQTWGSVNGWDLGLEMYQTQATLEEFTAPVEYKEIGEIIDFVY